MSKANSFSKRKAKICHELATNYAYASEGKSYADSINPYPENTFDHFRFKRFYEKVCIKYHRMEKEFEHMAEMYGEFRPEKLKL